MRSYTARGYTVVKQKIGLAPLAEDLRRIEAVLAVPEPGQRLQQSRPPLLGRGRPGKRHSRGHERRALASRQ